MEAINKQNIFERVISYSGELTIKPLHFKYALLDGIITDLEYCFYFESV